jgi:hypothetical protein
LQFGIFGAVWLLPRKGGAQTKREITMSLHTPDLTKQPPRSPRVRLGGYAILPRCLDKGRATVAGKNGEYHYACPLDHQFLDFVGIDPEALKKELPKSDTEILAWIQQHAKHPRTAPEVIAWTHWQENRAPDNTEGREYLNALHKAGAPDREDIITWFDVLDLDDYVSFGGKA